MLTQLYLTNEQGREKLMTSFHSELTVLSSDINIACIYKLVKIGENLTIHQGDSVFDQDFCHFSTCLND